MHQITIFPDREQLSRAVARAFIDSVGKCSSAEIRFSLALAGGSTPRLLYELLGTEYRNRVAWHRVHFFFSDERYVSPDHPDSNYGAAHEALLDRIDVPESNIHAPRTDLEDPEEAATRYERELRDFFGTASPSLDWVLLGLGEDGHLASLFPHSSSLEETRRWVVAVRDSPKPPPIRITMTLPLINGASKVHFLVSGRDKRNALRAALAGPSDPAAIPAQSVLRYCKAPTWWVDEAAAGVLSI